jgi:hypothetical protein
MNHVQLAVEDFVTDGNARGMGLHLSTYDVPRSGSADFEPSTGTLSIKLNYIDKEPSKDQVLEDHIAIRFGKNSGKILEIIIHVAKGNIGQVRLSVANALEQVDRDLSERVSRAKRFNQRKNYEGVQGLLTRNRTAVVSSTAAY